MHYISDAIKANNKAGEMLNKQAEIYETLGVTPPTSSC